MRNAVLIGFFIVAIFGATQSRADQVEIKLTVSDGAKEKSAMVATDSARPEVMASAGDARFKARWKLTYKGKETWKDALVHFYVVRIEKSGQAPPPLEPKEVVIESAQTLDFYPGVASSAEVEFRVDRPGLFLIRVEARMAAETVRYVDAATIELSAGKEAK